MPQRRRKHTRKRSSGRRSHRRRRSRRRRDTRDTRDTRSTRATRFSYTPNHQTLGGGGEFYDEDAKIYRPYAVPAAPAYLGYTSSYYDPAPVGYGQVYSVGAPVVAANGLSFVDGAAGGDLYGSTGLYGSGLGGGLGALYSSTGFGRASNDWGVGGSAVVMPSAGDFIAGGGGYGAGFGFY